MNNRIAELLRVIAIIILLISIGLCIFGLFNFPNNLALLITGIGGAVSCAFVRGFAEVIELLETIKNNGKNSPIVRVNAPIKEEVSDDDELPEI